MFDVLIAYRRLDRRVHRSIARRVMLRTAFFFAVQAIANANTIPPCGARDDLTNHLRGLSRMFS